MSRAPLGRGGRQSTQASGSSGLSTGTQGSGPLGSGPFERRCWHGDRKRVESAGRAGAWRLPRPLSTACVWPPPTWQCAEGRRAYGEFPHRHCSQEALFRTCSEARAPHPTPRGHPRDHCGSDARPPQVPTRLPAPQTPALHPDSLSYQPWGLTNPKLPVPGGGGPTNPKLPVLGVPRTPSYQFGVPRTPQLP